eukprot:10784538-Alexandrium_andersonii.AAC.1
MQGRVNAQGTSLLVELRPFAELAGRRTPGRPDDSFLGCPQQAPSARQRRGSGERFRRAEDASGGGLGRG